MTKLDSCIELKLSQVGCLTLAVVTAALLPDFYNFCHKQTVVA